MSDATLKTIVGLHREPDRRARMAISTPEGGAASYHPAPDDDAERNNHLPEIELIAEQATKAVRHSSGALTAPHGCGDGWAGVGLTIVHTDDLPHPARAVVDLEHGRIYIPPAFSIPGGHGLRSLALQAMANTVLEHGGPTDHADFLRQRLEASYFAAACPMPRAASVDFLERAKRERNIAIEDFRDTFGVTHEGAALRFTNLATHYLGITLHYLWNNGDGTVEGTHGERRSSAAPGRDLLVRRRARWSSATGAREKAFARATRTSEHYQYTDTPAGTFFESTQTGTGATAEFSITLGVPYAESKWFRGANHSSASCARRAQTRGAAAGRRMGSRSAGGGKGGRRPGCGPTCSLPCRRGPIRVWTIANSTSSSRRTRTTEPSAWPTDGTSRLGVSQIVRVHDVDLVDRGGKVPAIVGEEPVSTPTRRQWPDVLASAARSL